jgi:hypothetical protein
MVYTRAATKIVLAFLIPFVLITIWAIVLGNGKVEAILNAYSPLESVLGVFAPLSSAIAGFAIGLRPAQWK